MDIPRFDLSDVLQRPADAEAQCAALVAAFQQYGCLLVRDPRVPAGLDAAVRTKMMRYFAQEKEVKQKDAHPEAAYDVGWVPPDIEDACPVPEAFAKLDPTHRPNLTGGKDPKERFMDAFSVRTPSEWFPLVNVSRVIPSIAGWKETIDPWGNALLNTAHTLAEMAARGFGLPPDTFTKLLQGGQHLYAPTGVHLIRHGRPGVVWAKCHRDLGLMTIHGKSNFPGLFIWTREGKRMPVAVPEGYLLVQAGKTFEWLTGGLVLAGYHEVVGTAQIEALLERVRMESSDPAHVWRVTTTCFFHLRWDELVGAIAALCPDEAVQRRYPLKRVGDLVLDDLKSIGLAP